VFVKDVDLEAMPTSIFLNDDVTCTDLAVLLSSIDDSLC